ncbi:MAG: hypothetical protein KJ674_00620 [Nanoarchaeota archaeon]|nr:hypothetical protein [Nanoarchaeota archaeon]
MRKFIVIFVISLFFVNFAIAAPSLQKISSSISYDLNEPPGSCSCILDGYGQYAHCDPGVDSCYIGFEQTCQPVKDSNNIVIACGCSCIGPDPVCAMEPEPQTQPCSLQEGVCDGSYDTCEIGQWPGCDNNLYLSFNSNYEESEGSCSDNLDNDCDGLTDCEENDCLLEPPCTIDECVYLNYFYNDDCEDVDDKNSWGKLCMVEDCSGSTEFWYDERGNVIKQEIFIEGYEEVFVLEYEYDSSDNLVIERLPNGEVIEFNYNSFNQIESIVYDGEDVSFIYNDKGFVDNINYDDFGIDYDYDNRDRVSDIDVESFGENIFSKSYFYDGVGNLEFLYEDGNLLAEYIYDNLHRLLIVDDDDFYDFDSLNFVYDNVGNRLNKNEDSNLVSYGYESSSNRLLEVDTGSDDILELKYDSSGNLIKMDDVVYDYDIENRLVSAGKEHYFYDYEGRRVKKVEGTISQNPSMQDFKKTTYYIYDIKGDMVHSVYEESDLIVSVSPIGGAIFMPRSG